MNGTPPILFMCLSGRANILSGNEVVMLMLKYDSLKVPQEKGNMNSEFCTWKVTES